MEGKSRGLAKVNTRGCMILDSDFASDRDRERNHSPLPRERIKDSASSALIAPHLGSQGIKGEEMGKGENQEGGPMHNSLHKTLTMTRGKCPTEGV